MSDREKMTNAFPFVSHGACADHQYVDPGMTLLDYFAGQAFTALVSRRENVEYGTYTKCEVASEAYSYAEAMLAESKRRQSDG